MQTLGLNCIPLRPKSKIPAIEWKEYQTKKFEGLITGNYGVICGHISGDLFVVDLDSPELYPLFEGFIDKTLVVKTSKGYHFYFRAKDGKLPKTVPLSNPQGLHLDIRAEGSFVVGESSIHESGVVYTIVSTTTNILEIDTQIIKKILNDANFQFNEQFAPSINEIVKFVPIGQRNNATFKYAAHLIGNLDLPDDMVWAELLRWSSQLDFKCPESELRLVFESAKKRVKRPNQSIPIAEALKQARELNLVNMRDITGAKYEGQTITFDGFIAVMYPHKTITIEANAWCSRCQYEKIKTSESYENVKPPICPDCQIKMVFKKDGRITTDVRTLLLQEFPEEAENNNPIRFLAKVKGNDVNKLAIGQRRRFTGIFYSKEDKDKEHNTPYILITDSQEIVDGEDGEITVDVLDKIQKDINENFIQEKLVNCFASDIEGQDELKEYILYTIAGGVRVGNRRGDINLGIIGNPGKGKSELLKRIKKITFKSTYVTGKRSSAAGLVYGMVKMPDGTMAAQAGPMVTNSGKNDEDCGFLLYDEADKAKRDDRHGLLECMEQQSASVVLSGIVIEGIPAKTAVIMACNPHFGRWVPYPEMTIMDNLQPLEKPFIDRFDVIYPIILLNREISMKIARHIVNQGKKKDKECYMDETTLKYYLQYVRKLKPTLSDQAGDLILDNYEKTLELMEKSEDVLYTEERQLIGTIRLATARAKILMKPQVDINDVNRIIYLNRKCLEAFGIKVNQDGMAHFPTNTKKENEQQAFLTLFKKLEDGDKEVTKSQMLESLKEHPQFKEKDPDTVINDAIFKHKSIYNPHGQVYKRVPR